MEKDYLYLSKEFLQKISNITNWMKENPQITDVNMYEVSECLLEFSFIEKLFNGIREFQDKEMCIEINNKITFLMKYMLDMRSKSITDFIDNMNIADLFDSFVKNSFDGIIEHDNKYKELISKEFGVLFYIYNVRKDNKEYQYDNTAEFEMLKNISNGYKDELSEKLIKAIEEYYKYNDRKKEDTTKYNKKICYDQIMFSSREEEREYIEKKTKEFDLDESLLEKTNNNGIIVITEDSLYAVEPVDIHQMAFQKLFRNIKDNDVFLDISEVEDYYVYEGNILIRTVNRGGVIGFDPYIPREINDYQIIQLERLLNRLYGIHKDLEEYDEKNADNIKYGIDTIKKSR